MTPQELVDALREVAVSGSAEDVLSVLGAPPGRRPSQLLVAESQWYRSLPPNDREMVARVLKRAAHAALFHVLAVLDGVGPVEGVGDKGNFVLHHMKDSEVVRLCGPGAPLLHDLLGPEA